MSNVEKDCRKYLGLYPFNNWKNVVVGDSYYFTYLITRYNRGVVQFTLERLKA